MLGAHPRAREGRDCIHSNIRHFMVLTPLEREPLGMPKNIVRKPDEKNYNLKFQAKYSISRTYRTNWYRLTFAL